MILILCAKVGPDPCILMKSITVDFSPWVVFFLQGCVCCFLELNVWFWEVVLSALKSDMRRCDKVAISLVWVFWHHEGGTNFRLFLPFFGALVSPVHGRREDDAGCCVLVGAKGFNHFWLCLYFLVVSHWKKQNLLWGTTPREYTPVRTIRNSFQPSPLNCVGFWIL